MSLFYKKSLHRLTSLSLAIGLSVLFSYWIFHSYGFFITDYNHNSDGLMILDFARDFLAKKSLMGWQLPHAPDLFPDETLAIIALFFTSWSDTTFLIIASINYLLVIVTFYTLLKNAEHLETPSLSMVALITTLCLLILLYFFKSALLIYYQIFVTGTHFETETALILILSLNESLMKKSALNAWAIFTLCFFSAILVASDSLCGIFIIGYLISNLFFGKWKNLKNLVSFLGLLFATITGFILLTFIPHSPLLLDFLPGGKINLFSLFWVIHHYRYYNFFHFLLSSMNNAWLIFSLIAAPFLFALLIQNNPHKECLKNPFVLATFLTMSTSILVPNWQIRYMNFPALFLLFCLVVSYFRVFALFKNNHKKNIIIYSWLIFIALGTHSLYSKFKMQPYKNKEISQLYQCIQLASTQYPLQDGIATYWHARALKFFSNFQYYLAQTLPPPTPFAKNGYWFWINNSLDFVYKNKNQSVFRQYNFIITTESEVKTGVWGNILNQATGIVSYQESRLYYFKDASILWQALFLHQPGTPHPITKQILLN